VDGNTNPCGELGDSFPLGEVRELASELTHAGFAMWRLILTPYCQVYELNMDTYYSSLSPLDGISIPTVGY
jgi:hypothetical protein